MYAVYQLLQADNENCIKCKCILKVTTKVLSSLWNMVTEFIVSDNRTSLHYVGTQEGLPLVGLKTLSTMGSKVITKIDLSNCNMGTVHSLFWVQLLEVQFSKLRALILDNCHLHDRVKLPRMPNVTILRYYLVRKSKAFKITSLAIQ